MDFRGKTRRRLVTIPSMSKHVDLHESIKLVVDGMYQEETRVLKLAPTASAHIQTITGSASSGFAMANLQNPGSALPPT